MDLSPVPDIEFAKRLAMFDKDLVIAWDRSQKVWQIWRRDPYTAKVEFIISVVNEDGSYRPLDDRTLAILKMNRFYAENPEIALKVLVDEPIEKRNKAIVATQDNLASVSKDIVLKKKFEKIKEMAGLVRKEDWKKPVIAKDDEGKPLYGPDGKPVYAYKPHASWFEGGAK